MCWSRGKANQANFDTSDLSFSSQAPGVWNQLPAWIWEADSVLVFDTRLKTFLFDETSKQDDHRNALSYAAICSDCWVLLKYTRTFPLPLKICMLLLICMLILIYSGHRNVHITTGACLGLLWSCWSRIWSIWSICFNLKRPLRTCCPILGSK